MYTSINMEEFLKLSSINIVDIRSNQSFNNNHMENAVNIPFEKLIVKPDYYLKSNQKYFIYCQKGLVSRKACQILVKLGYHVVDILGGYEEWILKK